jgi:PPOX class probable F420-dependent enzyme
MSNRRGSIAMSEDEVQAFLESERVLTVASLGRDGWPHVMPLWYAVRDGEVWAWTYGKSQKVRNLERESRCTLQVEAGDSYGELRGVMIKAACAIHHEPEIVAAVGTDLARRYGGGDDAHVTAAQASKRVALQFVAASVASWDHRKL